MGSLFKKIALVAVGGLGAVKKMEKKEASAKVAEYDRQIADIENSVSQMNALQTSGMVVTADYNKQVSSVLTSPNPYRTAPSDFAIPDAPAAKISMWVYLVGALILILLMFKKN